MNHYHCSSIGHLSALKKLKEIIPFNTFKNDFNTVRGFNNETQIPAKTVILH